MDPGSHPFVRAPHRTLCRLSAPVLLSLIAEPLTGLVDTAFVADLGTAPLAALGVGTIVLSGAFWIFNFLGVATQTEVARASGAGESGRAGDVATMAAALALGFGVVVGALGIGLAEPSAVAMGAEGTVVQDAAVYLRIRWLGAPFVILTTAAFGALRGLQDMRTPLRIAVAVNVLNVGLDAALIPRFGIAGAAWATVGSQGLGAIACIVSLRGRLGVPVGLRSADARLLLVVGGDLFVRTALLTAFLVLSTRTATRIGEESGAAHQAVRQVWVFLALVLDAYAIVAQSLVGWFRGARRVDLARRVAGVSVFWSVVTGAVLGGLMLVAEDAVAGVLVPVAARDEFFPAWRVAALSQVPSAVSFATDGVHWGTGDYRFLRNAMIVATFVGVAVLWTIDVDAPGSPLTTVWLASLAWSIARATLGLLRIWPGIGRAPLAVSGP